MEESKEEFQGNSKKLDISFGSCALEVWLPEVSLIMNIFFEGYFIGNKDLVRKGMIIANMAIGTQRKEIFTMIRVSGIRKTHLYLNQLKMYLNTYLSNDLLVRYRFPT